MFLNVIMMTVNESAELMVPLLLMLMIMTPMVIKMKMMMLMLMMKMMMKKKLIKREETFLLLDLNQPNLLHRDK